MGEFIDKVKGHTNEAIGKLKQESSNPETRAHGISQEMKGKGQQMKGDIKGKLGDDI